MRGGEAVSRIVRAIIRVVTGRPPAGGADFGSRSQEAPRERSGLMSEVENIAIVRRFYDEVFDRQNLDLADTLVAPHFKNHTAPPGMQDGPEGIKAIVRMLF